MDQPSPEITGLSPKVAPDTGGTKVSIRGANLGLSEDDIIGLTLCGISHLQSFKWISPQKLEVSTLRINLDDRKDAIVDPNTNLKFLTGSVLVTTSSGGVSPTTLQFTFNQTEDEQFEDDLYDVESDVWVDRTPRGLYLQKEAFIKTSVVIETDTDPLGILRSLKSKIDAPSSFKNCYPNGSSDPNTTNFVPALFLAEYHRCTPLEYLLKGLDYLGQNLENRSGAARDLMKENFDRYVACQDSIIAVMKLLEDEFSKLDNENVLESLSLSLRNSIENCDQFVRPLLYRKKRMDCIRNTLNVLQRFKFLFQLPQNLKFSMKTGNYGHAVNEILKAEILYNTSDVHLFKLAMSKVRKVKAEMIQTFYDKLKDKNCTLKQSKKFISYLTELLGESADPGWECIKILSNNIISTLKDAEEQSKNDLLKLSNDQAPYEKIAVEFVNKANECFVSHFSSLWQLSQSYFHGTFHKKMTEVVLKNLQDNKVDFEGLCSSVVKEYELLFERAFWPSDGTLPRMDLKFITDPLPLIRCIEVIFAGYENVSHLQYIHASITSSLFSLAIKFRTYCLKPILHQTLIDIEELKKWDIFVRFLEEPTWLCEEYASIIENCLLSIAHVVNMEINMPNSQNLQVNTESNPKAASFLVKRMLSIYFSHIVQFFRYYAFESPLTEEVEMYKSDSQNYNILLGTPGEEASALTTELDTNGLHVQFQRYLRVVTWCIHSRNIVVPTLCRLFEDRFGLGLEEEQQNINEEFEDLKKEALENYIQSKTKVLAQQLDLCLLVPRMNEGVREFVSVLLHELITIYYEVDCTGTNLTKDVFHVLIKNAMSRCSQAVLDANEGKIPAIKGSSITRLWNKQMLIDLRALKLFTGQHFTTEAEQLFVEIKEFLLESSDPAEESHNKQVLENFKTENQFGITCLQF